MNWHDRSKSPTDKKLKKKAKMHDNKKAIRAEAKKKYHERITGGMTNLYANRKSN